MKWALIGASTIASQHMIGAIRAQEGHSVSSVLSSDSNRGSAYADAHDIPEAFTDLDAQLSGDIDAVYISTTNEKHHAQAMAAIAAGKHVLCEKPLAMTVAEAVAMVRAAAEKGVTFGTNHHLRNAGSHLRIRELIADGRIGTVQAVRVAHAVYLPPNLQGWRIDNPAAGGGVIPDIVVHDADTVRFHLQEDPAEVVAIERSESLGRGVEDSVMSVWQMPSGVTVQTHEGFTIRHAGTSFEIHGTKGSIVATGVMTQQPVGDIVLRTEAGEEAVSFSDHNLYARAVGLFADACAGNGSPSATGIDGVKSLAVAAAVKKAATTGQKISVDYGGV
ncbi:Gfo/Idh/MocA family oxidoreductase [uncultured Roseobacter sp.]|uniref:Gfo/Idh/MocA family protein n=1 Tax=uncultured Roseobacter sp. TaxID=114847 RepID=UPI00261E3CBB|nr:Gfo/Idh/MocA family oxidoreductase [uncultured Roseobacter sp.]